MIQTSYIVDDELEIIILPKNILGLDGYNVSIACNGKEAIETLNDSINLVILGLTLPDTNGFDLCRKIRSKKSDYFFEG